MWVLLAKWAWVGRSPCWVLCDRPGLVDDLTGPGKVDTRAKMSAGSGVSFRGHTSPVTAANPCPATDQACTSNPTICDSDSLRPPRTCDSAGQNPSLLGNPRPPAIWPSACTNFANGHRAPVTRYLEPTTYSGAKMKRALAAATALLALPLAALASPAEADSRCSITNFSPRTVVAGTGPVLRKFNVSTTNCSKQGWAVEGEDFSFFAFDEEPEFVFEPFDNFDAGASDVIVEAYNGDYNASTRIFADGFRLQRQTGWNSFDASPEVIAKGGSVTVRGRLIIADWQANQYVGFPNKSAVLEFRAATGATYRPVKTVTTGSGGYLSVTSPVSQDGYWRLRYAGSSWSSGSLSAGDYIDVK